MSRPLRSRPAVVARPASRGLARAVRRGPLPASASRAARAWPGADAASRARALGALAQGRAALTDLTAELDGVLRALRGGAGALDPAAPDRLRAALRRAGAALCALPAT